MIRQKEIFIGPFLQWHRPWLFRFHLKYCPIESPRTTSIWYWGLTLTEFTKIGFAKFCWNWSSGSRSGEELLNFVEVHSLFPYYLPLEKAVELHLKKTFDSIWQYTHLKSSFCLADVIELMQVSHRDCSSIFCAKCNIIRVSSRSYRTKTLTPLLKWDNAIIYLE